jgi:hypothetical protein
MNTLARSTGIALFALIMVTGARSQGRFGIGLVVGEPTGIAFKYRLSGGNAVDGALGFSPVDRFRFNVGYLWHSHPFETRDLALHYGAGGAFGFGRTDYVALRDGRAYLLRSTDLGFAARFSLGLTYTIPRSPLDAFFEVAPLVIIVPNAGLGLDLGIGMRIYP